MRSEALTSLQKEILGLGHEDYYGLWEIWGLIDDQIHSNSEEETNTTAAANLGKLIELGWMELFRFAQGRQDRDCILVPKHEALPLLERPEIWKVPEEGDDQLRVATTDEGERVVREFW